MTFFKNISTLSSLCTKTHSTFRFPQAGVVLDHTRQDGRAPIHCAKEKHHVEAFKFLYHELLARQNLRVQQKRSGRLRLLGMVTAGVGVVGVVLHATGRATIWDAGTFVGNFRTGVWR